MKKFPVYLILILSLSWLASCNDDDDNNIAEVYEQWNQKNIEWLAGQQARTNPDGTPYFQTLVPDWDPAAYVLIHYFNDRSKTEGNLSPLYTSTVDTRYILHYCDGTAIDSSYMNTQYGPAIFRTKLNSVITGWTIALENMRVGDTAEVVVPYQSAYGVNTSSGILPYSNLQFNVSLVDIVYYETNPK